MKTEFSPNYITNQDAFNQLMQQLATFPFVCIDVEFMSGNTYHPTLCLVQLALPSEEIFLIDTLQFTDISAFKSILENSTICKVLHDAKQDLQILARATHALPKNIFDTQLACGFIGQKSTLSLAAMLDTLIGVGIDKTAQRTDWEIRPLSEAQLIYAIDDVRYLGSCYKLIQKKLSKLNRLSWAEEEFIKLEDPSLFLPPKTNLLYKKIKGRNRLDLKNLAVLRELTIWREEKAFQQNIPRNHLIPDDLLYILAQRLPTTPQKILRIRHHNLEKLQPYLQELPEVISEAKNSSTDGLIEVHYRPKNQELVQALTDVCLGIIKLESQQHAIDHALIGSRAEIESWIRGIVEKKKIPSQMEGWRKSFIGDKLLKLIIGEVAMRFVKNGTTISWQKNR